MTLEVDHLNVSYGRVLAVRDLSLSVGPKESVAVIGPNGAGKTSLLNAIFGRKGIDSGTVHFAGKSISGLAPEAILERGLSMVPEGRHIFHTLTVEENLRLGALALSAGQEQAVEEWLERFPVLSRYRKRPAGLLSGGEQQQLAIARAMASRPQVLLLDEPSLGLAPKIIDQVFELLEELRNQSIAILLVEQNAHRAIRFADRTYVLRSGGVVLSATREEMEARQDDMTSAYFGG